MTIALRLLLLSFLLFPHITEARSLFWQEIAVKASLDKEGRLHIREQQTMIFSGDWNGGETFLSVASAWHFQHFTNCWSGGRHC